MNAKRYQTMLRSANSGRFAMVRGTCIHEEGRSRVYWDEEEGSLTQAIESVTDGWETITRYQGIEAMREALGVDDPVVVGLDEMLVVDNGRTTSRGANRIKDLLQRSAYNEWKDCCEELKQTNPEEARRVDAACAIVDGQPGNEQIVQFIEGHGVKTGLGVHPASRSVPSLYALAAAKGNEDLVDRMEHLVPERQTRLHALVCAMQAGQIETARRVLTRIPALSADERAPGIEPQRGPTGIIQHAQRTIPGSRAILSSLFARLQEIPTHIRQVVQAKGWGAVGRDALMDADLRDQAPGRAVITRIEDSDARGGLLGVAREVTEAMELWPSDKTYGRIDHAKEKLIELVLTDEGHIVNTKNGADQLMEEAQRLLGSGQGPNAELKERMEALGREHDPKRETGRIARLARDWASLRQYDMTAEAREKLDNAAMFDRDTPGSSEIKGAVLIEKIARKWDGLREKADERTVWELDRSQAETEAINLAQNETTRIREEYETGTMSPDRARKMLFDAAQKLRIQAETAPLRELIEHVMEREDLCARERYGRGSRQAIPEVRELEERWEPEPGIGWEAKRRHWEKLRNELEKTMEDRPGRVEAAAQLMDDATQLNIMIPIEALVGTRKAIEKNLGRDKESSLEAMKEWAGTTGGYQTARAHIEGDDTESTEIVAERLREEAERLARIEEARREGLSR